MLLKILFAHSLGDYFLQSDYLAMNKGKDNYLLCIHAILYTFGVSLILNFKKPLFATGKLPLTPLNLTLKLLILLPSGSNGAYI